jgi:hypothetical protein
MTYERAHSEETKNKIASSRKESSWRRRAKDKSKSDLQCATGSWEEDYCSPSIQWKGRALLWEEYSHVLDYDR